MVSMYNKGFARIPVSWAEDIFTKLGTFWNYKTLVYPLPWPGAVSLPRVLPHLVPRPPAHCPRQDPLSPPT